MAVRSQGSGVQAVARGVGAPAAVRAVSVTVNPGLLSVGGKELTVTVPGVKTTDLIFPTAPNGLSLGIGIGGARASAADTVKITLTCTLALGLSLGNLTLQLLIFEM